MAYGSNEKDINKEKVILALKTAEAWDFVKKMEFGIDTVLNEFGTNLSGGQRQRIALARAFYKNATFKITGKNPGTFITKKGAPMVYGITVVEHGNKLPLNKDGAIKFVNFVISSEGQTIMKKNGQGVIDPPVITGDSSILGK